MKWVDGANYGMLGADVGFAAYAGGAAAIAEGAAGAAALGAGALAAAPAIIAVGGAYALDKFGVTGWMTNRFVGAGDALGLTIGRGGSHPACVGDAVAHSSGFWGIVGGLAVGVAIGALVAATVATGGLLGVVLAGAALAGGLSLGSALAAASQSMGSDCGRIMTGSGNVFSRVRRSHGSPTWCNVISILVPNRSLKAAGQSSSTVYRWYGLAMTRIAAAKSTPAETLSSSTRRPDSTARRTPSCLPCRSSSQGWSVGSQEARSVVRFIAASGQIPRGLQSAKASTKRRARNARTRSTQSQVRWSKSEPICRSRAFCLLS